MTLEEIKHLHWRAGFGIQEEVLSNKSFNKKQVIDALFDDSASALALNVDVSYLDGINLSDIKTNPSLAKKLREKNRKKALDINIAWMERMTYSKDTLRERMTLFWANHFVCQDKNPKHILQYNNTLRSHALGDFRTFIKAISKEAAMLKYLNGKQNRKRKPNENFARELMELFTLGEGFYTELDIKESARAFTGYNHNFEGSFVFMKLQHDYGFKTFLNRTGRFNGEDIIDIILENKQCARFISDKIYRYFVNPKPNITHIEAMTEVFYKDYNIEELMRFVFTSDWFYFKENIGAKIKSPIELLVGMTKTVPFKFERKKDVAGIQKLLGQMLLKPPNVAGWKGDKAWIDASTIMIRLRLPSMLLNNAVIPVDEYGAFNERFKSRFFKKNNGKLPFKILPDWDMFLKNFQSVKTIDLADIIIQGKFSKGTKAFLDTLKKASKRDYCVQLMSLPEYQMC